MKLFYLLRYFLWNNFRSAVSEEYSVALVLILSEYDNRAVMILLWVHTLIANVKANIRGTYYGYQRQAFPALSGRILLSLQSPILAIPTFDRILSALSTNSKIQRNYRGMTPRFAQYGLSKVGTIKVYDDNGQSLENFY